MLPADTDPAPDGESVRAIAELSRRARAALGGAFLRCPSFLVPSFRLWHYPAAGLQVTWALFQRRIDTPKGVHPVLRRILWDRDEDLARLVVRRHRRPCLDPTLVETQAELDEAELNPFVREAATLSLPFRALQRPYVSDRPPEFGLEGFDLEGRDGRPVVRIEWSAEYAAGFKGIADWSARVRSWFLRMLP